MSDISQAPLASAPADAKAGNWVDRYAPERAKPYLRLMRADRPIGTWLLLIPCWQGLALALAETPSKWKEGLYYGILCAIGAIAMRGAGCAYNDIVDKDFDAMVARTALRPLPSGQISLAGAWTLLIALSLAGLAVLLQFNPYTIALGLASLGLVALYPFMKRVTWWPQAWLGLTFNWGALVGFAAVAGRLAPEAVALYASGVFWTLGYDTIYAHQDKEDDALIGVKSSARRLGEATRPWLFGFYGATLALLIVAGLLARLPAIYFVALAAPAFHFFVQARTVNIENSASCLKIFRSNRDAGFLALAAFLSAALLQF